MIFRSPARRPRKNCKTIPRRGDHGHERALSRIAKEGRKYGVFLGLVTQRPAEIDSTIISQCSTLFVMRLSNDRDQSLIRSAVSDAAVSLLSFYPVARYPRGVHLLRPNSEAAGDTRSDAGTNISRDLLSTVIERWRSASMSHRGGDDEFAEYNSPLDAAPLQPAAPPMPVPPSPRGEALRSSLLKKPLDATSFGTPPGGKPGLPPQRFR